MALAPFSISADNIEFSVTLDGVQRWRGLLLYTSPAVSVSASCRLSPGGTPDLLAGLNTAGFSIGHLGDAGLAAEVRNPGHDSLSRLSERTFFHADLRSLSLSRIGLAIMPLNARVGVVWERREDIDAGILWAVPISTDSWTFEILGEAGLLREIINDDAWYPDYPWRPAGPFGLVSGRLRHVIQEGSAGLTVMMSGGVNLRRGWLAALSLGHSSGPWRVRSRTVYSSSYFRNADGDRIDVPVGSAFDCRYRPVRGLQFTIDYEAGIKKIFPELRVFTDEGSAAAGWRFGEIQLSLESDWNRIFSGQREDDMPLCRRLKMRIIWDRNFLHLGLLGTLEPQEGWALKLENAFPARGSWLMETFVEIHKEHGPLLLDFRIKGRWDIGNNRFIISIFAGDLMRDWHGGPASAGDFEAEIRWVHRIR